MKNTSQSGPPVHNAHVHKLLQQVLKPRDSVALRKVQHPPSSRTSVPIDKARNSVTLLQLLPGEPCKFHLKPEHKPTRYVPRKVPIHLEDAFNEKIKSLVELGILEEVTEHTDSVTSYVIVEKDSGNHHAPNHTIKRN